MAELGQVVATPRPGVRSTGSIFPSLSQRRKVSG